MNSVAGCFVVASPHLPDPNFYRTVVLMIRHDDEGAFGVVLTRPLNSSLAEVWSSLGVPAVTQTDLLHLGGPVSGALLALHCEPDLSEGEVIAGVYLASSKENLNRLVLESKRPFRIFTGYSGWSEGQLESEFAEGSWLSTPATLSELFSSAVELWKSVADRIGLEILLPHAQSVHIPIDPEMN